MYFNNNVEIRVSGVSYSLKKELFALVEQRQKALGNKKYSLSDLVIEVLENYVSESYEEKIQKEKAAEHQQFLQDVAREVSKVEGMEKKLDLLITSLNSNTTTIQELINTI